MNGWTKLHEKAVESVHLSELLDDEPDAFALFILMLAKAGVWGRFPGHPKLLKARVAPMSDRLTAQRIEELLPMLRERGFVTAYIGDNGEPLLYTTNHFEYNEKQAWHRVGKPEFPPPPNFVPPDDLAGYLSAVAEGRYKGKTVESECEKFGVVTDKSETTPTDNSQGLLPGSGPQALPALQTLDVRRADVQTTAKTGGDAPSTSRGTKRPDAHMILSNYAVLAQAVREVYGKHWTLAQQQDFVADAGAALDEPGCTISEQDSIDALRGDGKPLPGDRGDWWIGKLCKSRAALSRQDPAAAADPVLAEFIRLHGQRPEDIFDLQDWSQKLAAYRQERTAVATGAAR